jgi:hypothetical protein
VGEREKEGESGEIEKEEEREGRRDGGRGERCVYPFILGKIEEEKGKEEEKEERGEGRRYGK